MTLCLQTDREKSLDIFSFFPLENAIFLPTDLWFECVCASLKRKHAVLILKAPPRETPSWNSARRWEIADEWCWLAPRSLSFISEAQTIHSRDLTSFLAFLKAAK
jgi:hypothetical protein